MSKHLLYRKDLPNRTLARGFLFVLAQLVAYLTILIPTVSPAEAAGPLSFKTTSPRYFFDSTGKSVYLTGSYLDEYNTLSVSWDFASYLDFLQQQKQNFTRVWGWEQSPWIYDKTGQIAFSTQPYQRTGPGLALDGALKFDLTRFNQAYFDQLRARVVEASRRGIYVSVMLFEGFSTQKQIGRVNPWLGDPFQQANNINGVSSDPNRNGGGEEFFSLAFPSLLTLQETFVRKVVDTLNDLDNVLYEVSGNGLAGSLSWQYRMIDYIKGYQAKKANQHPVGISDFYAGAIAEVFNSSADWIVVPETNLNLPPATSNKVLVMEGTPVISGDQVLSTSPISLLQLLPEGVTSTQSPSISNTVPSSNGVTPSSSSATSSTLSTTSSSSNSQQSKVATPTITPNGGIYSGRVSVTLETTTPGASIYYTTDGQSPTQSSRPYTGKFPLSDSTLVKAKAFKSNFEPSSETSAWFANAASPAVSGSSLVAHWKFDEGNGTTASDSSGNGNTGTLVNGPQWTAGKVGNALYFDGIDDVVTVVDSNSLDLSSSFTLSAWVNPASTFTDFRSILIKNYKYYLYASVAGYCGDGTPLGGFSEGANTTVCQPSPLPINTWTHLAVTYNGSTLTLYRNGVAVATSNFSGTLSPTTGALHIGASQFGEYFKGLIDEVRIYNSALAVTEIQTIYQQDSGATSQTVATPVISPSGGNYSGSVSVAMQTATSGASIYYTTNGSTPTQSSTLYTGTMTLTSSATVKAKAFKSGFNASADASASFTVTQPFNFTLSTSGNKSVIVGSSVTNSISATLASGSAQAVTFSTSGLPTGATASFSSATCSPTCSSTLTINTSGATPAGSSSVTVTASGGGVTKTTTFSLTMSLPTVTTVATPTITPNGGSFTGSVSVTMQTATSGASIYYTTNGSTPTQSSTLYTGAMTLTSSAVVKTKAFKSGYNSSAEASASFSVSPSGLMAYWKFDEGSGTTVSDASGNGNTGTLVNGPLRTAGRVGNGLYFDGIDDNITVPDSNSLDLSSAFTLSAWVNPVSTYTDFRSILVKNYKYYLYASVAGYCGDGSPLAGFDEQTTNAVCQPSPLPINTWTHLTVTYNGSSLTLYRNGVAVATSNVSGTLSPTTGTLQIGGSQFGEYFQGLIDEVRIYNRALSNTEIQALYQQDSALAATAPVIPNASQPFSFSLSNSGDKSVVAGSSVTNSIAVTLSSGSSQAVSFSVSGLPSGATGSFSMPSCSPACSTILNIVTSGSTPAGNFPISVSSTGGSVTKTTAFTLSVTLALTVATPTITPNGGNFSGSVSVAMQTATSGASIYYTTDGSTPSQSSPLYSGAMTLTSSATVKAAAFKSGYNPSTVAAASFTNSQTGSTGTGNVYYVAKTGSNSYSCSQAKSTTTPKLSITSALACLAAGDTLMIRAGTYLESDITPPGGKSESTRVVIRSYPGETVIVKAPTGTTPDTLFNLTLASSYLEIDGLILDASNVGFAAGTDSAHHIRIKNTELKNSRGVCLGFFNSGLEATYHEFINLHVHHCGSHGLYLTSDNNLIDGGEWHDNAQDLSNQNASHGIHVYISPEANKGAPDNNIIRNAKVYNNKRGPGIAVYWGNGNRIYNNITWGNLVGITAAGGNGLVANNTVYNNSVLGIWVTNSGNTVKNNIAYQNKDGNIQNDSTNYLSNNLTVDPKFMDAVSGNFKLQSNSAAIDVGTPLVEVLTDFDGVARPKGLAFDIGAYEY